jgi:SAM-dependent methyltransferase
MTHAPGKADKSRVQRPAGQTLASRDEPLSGIIDRTLNYGRPLIRRFLATAARGQRFRTVLDIGAGQGTDLMLARAVDSAAELHAIEVFPPNQEDLRRKGVTVHGLNLEHERFPLARESVDVVIANQVLEHVKEIFWIFHEVTRVLRVGGSLIIGVPNLASLHNRALLLCGRQPTCLQNHSAHVRGYTSRDLVKFLEVCFPGGYRLVQFGGSNFYPFPAILATPLARAFPNLAWGIFLRLEKQRAYERGFLSHPIKSELETNFYVGE